MTIRKPRKMGLYDSKIAKEKQSWRIGKDAFGLLYGSRNYRTVFLEAIDSRDMDNCPDRFTPAAQHFTEHGDFTHLSGRGI